MSAAGLVCGVCGLTGGPFASRAEAAAHARTHDGLHHRGMPTITVTPGATETAGSGAGRGRRKRR